MSVRWRVSIGNFQTPLSLAALRIIYRRFSGFEASPWTTVALGQSSQTPPPSSQLSKTPSPRYPLEPSQSHGVGSSPLLTTSRTSGASRFTKCCSIWEIDPTRPDPTLSRPLRGRLSVGVVWSQGSTRTFVDALRGLRPEYEELVLAKQHGHCVVAAVEDSLKRLTMHGDICMHVQRLTEMPRSRCNCPPDEPPADLSRCPELRQPEITTTPPGELERTLISSITPINLQKLVFLLPSQTPGATFHTLHWALFDDTICGLVDRLFVAGYKHTLAVEFRTKCAKELEGKVTHGKFLPKFKEKGQVRVVEVSSGKDRVWL